MLTVVDVRRLKVNLQVFRRTAIKGTRAPVADAYCGLGYDPL